jgi:hypothetical protein
MSLSRPFIAALSVGALGIAGIGLGAGATFTDAVNATQVITAGTPGLMITDGAGGAVSPDGKSVTLPAPAPVGSTFETTHRVITVTNTGNIDLASVVFKMTEAHNDNDASRALLSQMNVCIQSTDTSGGPWTEGNGPLVAAVALGVVQNPVTLTAAPGPSHSMTFSVDFYAGQNSTHCNATHSDGKNTRAAWDGYLGGAYHTPPSLTSAAIGGVVAPTLTFSFTG